MLSGLIQLISGHGLRGKVVRFIASMDLTRWTVEKNNTCLTDQSRLPFLIRTDISVHVTTSKSSKVVAQASKMGLPTPGLRVRPLNRRRKAAC